MNVTPDLIQRTRSAPSDTEDLALLYMEEEVGRFDWSINWPKLKERTNIRERIQEWLNALHVEHNPDEIIAYLDQMLTDRPGRWL